MDSSETPLIQDSYEISNSNKISKRYSRKSRKWILIVLIITLIGLLCGVLAIWYFFGYSNSTKNVETSKKALLNVWPQPQQSVLYDEKYFIHSNEFNFITKTNGECDILVKAIERCKSNAFLQDCSRLNSVQQIKSNKKPQFNGTQLKSITITISKPCEQHPYIYMNEKYKLLINNSEANIITESIWGALWGLETFSQLINHIDDDLFVIDTIQIIDYPRFVHRGVMLDTSRHYVPMKVLLDNLDAMTYNKMNVFHWHIVDDPSFPFESKKFTNLSDFGAFNNKTHIYTQEQVKEVINYARERGIRVLVEFDTPGHTQSWGKGQPNLLSQCYEGTFWSFIISNEKPNGKYGPIDPTKTETYTFLIELFSEISQIFPDEYIHVGGDEVDFSCWKNNPKIKQFMSKNSINSVNKLEEYYIQNVLDIIGKLNRSYIVWQDVYDNNVNMKQDTVVQIWKYNWEQTMKQVTGANYHAILSSCWYLDMDYSYGQSWTDYYKCDPENFGGTQVQMELVLGGEACQWGEFVDGSNLISRTWPPAITVAERLWSPKEYNDPEDARWRFNAQRCRMQQRGIAGYPSAGPSFCKCDFAL